MKNLIIIIIFTLFLLSNLLSETQFIAATKGDGYAFVYFPTVLKASVNLNALGFANGKSWWYDPQTGETKEGEQFKCKGIKDFSSLLSGGRGNDYILVIDDISKNFSAPGNIKAHGPLL